MIFGGVDVGVQTIKIALLGETSLIGYEIVTTEDEGSFVSQDVMGALLRKLGISFEDITCVVSTGIGRTAVPFAQRQRTEQLCHGKGAHWFVPSARTVLDIGAGGSRVMKLNDEGKVVDFAINSKCAAGTGKFLESMASFLEMPLEEMSKIAVRADKEVKISSYCAVFAESEVISCLHRGIPADRIIAGVHGSVVVRVVELIQKLGLEEDLVITGGVAKNPAIVTFLERQLNARAKVTENPQLVGAIGAAIFARESIKR
jgi:(R)-2-hydroxyacyl-CoA dehydratese activating ATPase